MSTPHRENGMETTGMKRCLYENDAREGCLVGMLWKGKRRRNRATRCTTSMGRIPFRRFASSAK